jgi:hypothetical protein
MGQAYRPSWCKDPAHRNHVKVGASACVRCGRGIGWALDMCWDCLAAARKATEEAMARKTPFVRRGAR